MLFLTKKPMDFMYELLHEPQVFLANFLIKQKEDQMIILQQHVNNCSQSLAVEASSLFFSGKCFWQTQVIKLKNVRMK
jgi:hypothetical protein